METIDSDAVRRAPWNKGKLVGQKAPLKRKEIWAIRVRLQLAAKHRELAMFNLAIDSNGWSRDDEATPAVVISDHFNEQMFGGGNSVGKTMVIDNRDYRVLGVIKHWNPQPEFFALVGGLGKINSVSSVHSIELGRVRTS